MIFRRIDEFLDAYPDESIDILWHGGEPLLLGPVFFQNIINMESRICHSNKDRMAHVVQTNLTLLSEEFVRLFKELGVQAIGTSIDPVTNLRGLGGNNSPEKYNRMFLSGLKLLENSGINWGVIYVISKQALDSPTALFHYLTNLHLAGVINLNPVLIQDEDRQDAAITPGEYTQFLGTIFPAWWEHRNRWPAVQPFRGLVERIINDKDEPGCMEFGVCDHKIYHLYIEPDGEVWQGGFSGQLTSQGFGNICDNSLADILTSKEMSQFINKIKQIQEGECKNCKLLDLCNPNFAKIDNKSENSLIHKSEWCESRIGFIKDYFEPVTGVKYEPKEF